MKPHVAIASAPQPGSSASNPLVIYLANPPTPVQAVIPPGVSGSQPLVVQIASVPSAGTPEPHWTGYLQAFATPVIALLAWYIARQQWKTAQNKLKSDLFEKRDGVYQAAVELVKSLHSDAPIAFGQHADFVSRIKAGKWFLSDVVNAHLQDLLDRSAKDRLRRPKRKKAFADEVADEAVMTDEAMSAQLVAMEQRKTALNVELARLDEWFKPFLTVAH
jgi:hypothetical protein